MKTCPFCKEDVHEDAIKCRFCHSMLLQIEAAEQKVSESTRVTYVLDRDLLRFAKFAGGVLAVFLVVGAYSFGFKLDSALDKARDTQEKLTEAQHDLKAAQATVANLKRDVETVLAEAKSILGDISAQKEAALALVVSIRQLNPREAAALERVKVERPDKVRRDSNSKLWATGATIRIRFLDGDQKSQTFVREIAREWTKYANLRFEFLTAGDAEVRLSFKQAGSWSFRGTDALAVPQDEATINLQQVEPRTVLHEFGHVLGLIEEHQNPRANIPWSKDLIYRELGGSPNFWSKEEIDRQIFAKVSAAELGDYRDFDPESVMNQMFSGTWAGGKALGGRNELSQSDKALVSRLYPPAR
ncbi:MAG: hypothetical protein HY348_05550 [Nitrospira defluvii]|nr:hypothetical protein [Nitrospira defluvii]